MQNIVYLATSLPRSKCASVATSAMLFFRRQKFPQYIWALKKLENQDLWTKNLDFKGRHLSLTTKHTRFPLASAIK